jgi:hypothetical protein
MGIFVTTIFRAGESFLVKVVIFSGVLPISPSNGRGLPALNWFIQIQATVGQLISSASLRHMNIYKQTRIRRFVLLFTALFITQFSLAAAQSSLFNIPTTEVMGKGEVYVEADFDAHFAKYRNGGWQNYGFLAVYGIAKNTETGLNAYVVRTADGFEPVEIQPNFKYRIYTNESNGMTVSTGAIAYIPLSRQFKTDSVASVYALAGKKFKGDWTPRLTGGAYQLIGASRDSGSKRGFLLGIEQSVHSRVMLIADWNTGKNRFGYSAAGVGITLTKNSYLYSAYYFGNEGRGNNSLGIYYGFSF